MKHLDIEVFVKELDKLFNDMQDKEIAGSDLVITAARVIENQAKENAELQRLFDKAMDERTKEKNYYGK